MTCIHENEVNNIAEYNSLHDIFNTYKCTKTFNSHHYIILQEWINTWKGRAKFENFWILFGSGYSSNIIMVRLITKLNPK